MAYTVKRWDSWSECNGLKGLVGLEALLNEERLKGWWLAQLVVHSEDIYVAVFEDSGPPARDDG
ncbi:MAG: hypothetical protein ACYCSF_02990 [Acidimicrobiales bacterium]